MATAPACDAESCALLRMPVDTSTSVPDAERSWPVLSATERSSSCSRSRACSTARPMSPSSSAPVAVGRGCRSPVLIALTPASVSLVSFRVPEMTASVNQTASSRAATVMSSRVSRRACIPSIRTSSSPSSSFASGPAAAPSAAAAEPAEAGSPVPVALSSADSAVTAASAASTGRSRSASPWACVVSAAVAMSEAMASAVAASVPARMARPAVADIPCCGWVTVMASSARGSCTTRASMT